MRHIFAPNFTQIRKHPGCRGNPQLNPCYIRTASDKTTLFVEYKLPFIDNIFVLRDFYDHWDAVMQPVPPTTPSRFSVAGNP